MKKLQKNKKMNNKGFSLVELIVVVLIMAIIAVAFAPQVVKWVGTAKKNTDEYNAAEVKSAVQVAVADFMSQGSLGTDYTSYTLEETGPVYKSASGESENTKLTNCLKDVFNGECPLKEDETTFTVKISSNGAIEIN